MPTSEPELAEMVMIVQFHMAMIQVLTLSNPTGITETRTDAQIDWCCLTLRCMACMEQSLSSQGIQDGE